MNGNSIIIRNGACLDPQHAIDFSREDLIVKNGVFQSNEDAGGHINLEVDVGGRIVIPGGIYPSFRPPMPILAYHASNIAEIARVFLMNGFTTIIVEGLSPSGSLDVHRCIQKLPFVNLVPIIDVANFQLMSGFLKNGITNYAAGLTEVILEKFKGYSISCFDPGSTVRWNNKMMKLDAVFDPIPFLNISIEKIIAELASTQQLRNTNPALLVETGIEGVPSGCETYLALLEKIAVLRERKMR